MKIIPKYWAYIDKHDGKGWQRLRVHDELGGNWRYALTYLQKNKEQKRAKAEGWGFRSKVIPTPKTKKPDKKNYPNKTHVTPNFTWKEFDSHDGAKMPSEVRKNIIRLARNLEKVREILGKPLPVISGYRSPRQNQAVGGAKNSQHMYGTAADINMKGLTQHEVIKAAEQVPAFRNGGIGAYPSGAVHLDVRGYPARWSSF